jgi:hypothetical protein
MFTKASTPWWRATAAVSHLRQGQHGDKELGRDIAVEQPIPVLAEVQTALFAQRMSLTHEKAARVG